MANKIAGLSGKAKPKLDPVVPRVTAAPLALSASQLTTTEPSSVDLKLVSKTSLNTAQVSKDHVATTIVDGQKLSVDQSGTSVTYDPSSETTTTVNALLGVTVVDSPTSVVSRTATVEISSDKTSGSITSIQGNVVTISSGGLITSRDSMSRNVSIENTINNTVASADVKGNATLLDPSKDLTFVYNQSTNKTSVIKSTGKVLDSKSAAKFIAAVSTDLANAVSTTASADAAYTSTLTSALDNGATEDDAKRSASMAGAQSASTSALAALNTSAVTIVPSINPDSFPEVDASSKTLTVPSDVKAMLEAQVPAALTTTDANIIEQLNSVSPALTTSLGSDPKSIQGQSNMGIAKKAAETKQKANTDAKAARASARQSLDAVLQLEQDSQKAMFEQMKTASVAERIKIRSQLTELKKSFVTLKQDAKDAEKAIADSFVKSTALAKAKAEAALNAVVSIPPAPCSTPDSQSKMVADINKTAKAQAANNKPLSEHVKKSTQEAETAATAKEQASMKFDSLASGVTNKVMGIISSSVSMSSAITGSGVNFASRIDSFNNPD